MIVRQPIVAGRFYEAIGDRCAADAEPLCAQPLGESAEVPETIVAAIVPHAGWVCSGRIAGGTFRTLAQRTSARTFLVTGSVHTMRLSRPTLDEADAWATPLGIVPVDLALREAVGELEEVDTLHAAHHHEHSVEVNLPLMQTAIGEDIRFVACMIPPEPEAPKWGEAIGRRLADWPEPVAMICSVDLTHYGPNYGLTAGGIGARGLQWARENDRRLIDCIEQMDAEAIVSETAARHNSCGGGAIAATVSAARAMGAAKAVVLEHTDSSRELARLGYEDHDNAVGYAGIVFGR